VSAIAAIESLWVTLVALLASDGGIHLFHDLAWSGLGAVAAGLVWLGRMVRFFSAPGQRKATWRSLAREPVLIAVAGLLTLTNGALAVRVLVSHRWLSAYADEVRRSGPPDQPQWVALMYVRSCLSSGGKAEAHHPSA